MFKSSTVLGIAKSSKERRLTVADSVGQEKSPIQVGAAAISANPATNSASIILKSNKYASLHKEYRERVEKLETANFPTAVSTVGTDALLQDIFSEIAPVMNDTQSMRKPVTSLNRIYRDMYYHDSICGSAVDMFSLLPFSSFSITGVDEKMATLFNESVELLNINTLLPVLSRDFLTLGTFIGSLSWDNEKGIYNGITHLNLDFVTVVPVPVFGMDPILSYTADSTIKEGVRTSSKYRESFITRVSEDINKIINGGGNGGFTGYELNPATTVYIIRRALLQDYIGISWLRRALAPWLIEKALMRGHMDQAWKRQRAITHITLGDGLDWIPTAAEMDYFSNLFMQADMDPTGAVVVTRNGVSVSDVRRGDDFYKWTDAYDSLSSIKLRALGITESFVTGEASWNSMEQTLTVIMDQIRGHRSLIASEFFDQKIFPGIAVSHDMFQKKQRRREKASAPSYNDLATYNKSLYVAPKIEWHKRLMPEGDTAYIDMLNGLSEKGIPIPIRMLAAAGGLDLKQIFEQTTQDMEDRTKLKEWLDKIGTLTPKPTEEPLGDGEYATVGRTFDSDREAINSINGKRYLSTAKGHKQREEAANNKIAKAMANIADKENRKTKHTESLKERSRQFYYTKPKKR